MTAVGANSPALAGLPARQQIVALDVTAALVITNVTSSNALLLTIGTL